MPLRSGRQEITIVGRGFRSGAKLTFVDLTRDRTFADKWPVSITGTRITRAANFGTVPSRWRVTVRNTDGTESPPFEFGVGLQVEPAAPAPVASASAPAQPAVVAPPPERPWRMFFRLLKGGLRTVTGAIGNERPNSYLLAAPAATLGIRGTDYVALICDAACALDPVIQASLPPGATTEGALIAGVHDGRIAVTSGLPICQEELSAAPEEAAPQTECQPAAGATTTELGKDEYLITLTDGTQRRLAREPWFLTKDPMPNPLECVR